MRQNERQRCFSRILCLALVCGLASMQGGRAAAYDSKDDKPLATARLESGLILEVVEIKRDEHEQVRISWRYRNPTDKPIELLEKSPVIGAGPKTAYLKNTYYEVGKLETGEGYRVPIVTTVKRNWIAKDLPKAAVVVGPKQQWEFWACFYLPKGDDEKITLHVADASPLEGLIVPKKADR
jgi:hypothetical protein